MGPLNLSASGAFTVASIVQAHLRLNHRRLGRWQPVELVAGRTRRAFSSAALARRRCRRPLEWAERGSGARERKVVSVLFCDLVGFTAASENTDPEEVQARIAPYHALTRERIAALGGTVEKFVGDAVMAVFGAPVAHEDDPERAVRAGLALLETIEELNAADASLALSVRVGVNTGEVVVSLGARPELGEEVLEQAHSLIGQGRCLTAVGDSGADLPLRQARALWQRMGAPRRINECDSLIVGASKLTL